MSAAETAMTSSTPGIITPSIPSPHVGDKPRRQRQPNHCSVGRPAWRALLPPEHGAWGFLASAAGCALISAPSWPGVLLALALGISLCARHGLRRVVIGRDREALVVTVLTGGICLLLVAACIRWASPWWWLPLSLAAPFAAGQFIQEWIRRGRRQGGSGMASVAGIAALSAGGAAIALAGGAGAWTALQITGMVCAYGTCSVVHIRRRFGRCTGRSSLLVHGGWMATAIIALAAGASWPVPAGATLLAGRALATEGGVRPSPARAGTQELLVGLAIAVMVGAGLRVGALAV